jgi:two pore calcium channel protein
LLLRAAAATSTQLDDASALPPLPQAVRGSRGAHFRAAGLTVQLAMRRGRSRAQVTGPQGTLGLAPASSVRELAADTSVRELEAEIEVVRARVVRQQAKLQALEDCHSALLATSPTSDGITVGPQACAAEAGRATSQLDALATGDTGEYAGLTSPVEYASTYVSDAFEGALDDAYKVPWLQHLYIRTHGLRSLVHVVYMFLSFFERPCWCYKSSCGDPADVLRSGIPVLPTAASELVELGCLALVVAEVALKRAFRGRWDGAGGRVKVVLSVVIAADVLAGLFGLNGGTGLLPGERVRLAPLLRPIVLFMRHSLLRQTSISMLRVLVAVRAPIILLGCLIVWFGMFAFVFMDQLCRPPECDEEENFGSLGASMKSVMVLLTTANFPDVMMSAYSYNRAFALPFILFLLYSLFFVVNVLLAHVYSRYKEELRQSATRFGANRQASLDIAFGLLAGGGGAIRGHEPTIPVATFQTFLDELARYPIAAGVAFGSAADRAAVIELVDQNHDGLISRDEFRELCVVLPHCARYLAEHRQRRGCPSCRERCCHRWRTTVGFARWRDLVAGRRFDHVVNVVVLINTATILARLQLEFKPGEAEGLISWWELLELGFSFMYLVELVTKLVVLGPSAYWRRWRHRFDCVVTVASVAAELAVAAGLLSDAIEEAESGAVVRYVVLVRMLRVARLFTNVQAFASISQAFIELIPAFQRLTTVLFLVMLTFSQVGIAAFGGRVYISNPALVGSNFASANYFANNFNDCASAMVVMFELLIVNNWFVLMNGTIASLPAGAWPRGLGHLFFISFYIVGVLVILNLVVAYVMEKYEQLMEWEQARREIEADGIGDFDDEFVKRAREAFQEFDTDGSGTISQGELQAVLRAMGQDATEAQMRKMLSELDGDGDGVLDLAEFMQMLHQQSQDKFHLLLRQHGVLGTDALELERESSSPTTPASTA